jgi:hypothetical protein
MPSTRIITRSTAATNPPTHLRELVYTRSGLPSRRTCDDCGSRRALTFFDRDPRGRRGYASACKYCRKTPEVTVKTETAAHTRRMAAIAAHERYMAANTLQRVAKIQATTRLAAAKKAPRPYVRSAQTRALPVVPVRAPTPAVERILALAQDTDKKIPCTVSLPVRTTVPPTSVMDRISALARETNKRIPCTVSLPTIPTPTAPPTIPATTTQSVPAVPSVPPTLPSIPSVPPTLPSIPSVPSVPPTPRIPLPVFDDGLSVRYDAWNDRATEYTRCVMSNSSLQDMIHDMSDPWMPVWTMCDHHTSAPPAPAPRAPEPAPMEYDLFRPRMSAMVKCVESPVTTLAPVEHSDRFMLHWRQAGYQIPGAPPEVVAQLICFKNQDSITSFENVVWPALKYGR